VLRGGFRRTRDRNGHYDLLRITRSILVLKISQFHSSGRAQKIRRQKASKCTATSLIVPPTAAVSPSPSH